MRLESILCLRLCLLGLEVDLDGIGAGIIILAILAFDIFQAVLVPRFTPASLRLAPFVVGKICWPAFKKFAGFTRSNNDLTDFILGSFAPFSCVALLLLWLFSITFAFALIILALGSEFHPQITDINSGMYLAGTCLLTVGFGDIVAVSPLGRAVLLASGTMGITVVAIGVSYLFSLQQAVLAREAVVHTMQARIAPHASAVHLLLNYADLGVTEMLAADLQNWENWVGQTLTSHRSFPVLFYFRSGHSCVSWITIFGVMLDVSNLLTSTVNDSRYAHSRFFLKMSCKMVNFFRLYFHLHPSSSSIDRDEFHSAYLLLQERGFKLHEEDKAWEGFHRIRNHYAGSLTALAENFCADMPGWVGKQTDLSHLDEHKVDSILMSN